METSGEIMENCKTNHIGLITKKKKCITDTCSCSSSIVFVVVVVVVVCGLYGDSNFKYEDIGNVIRYQKPFPSTNMPPPTALIKGLY